MVWGDRQDRFIALYSHAPLVTRARKALMWWWWLVVNPPPLLQKHLKRTSNAPQTLTRPNISYQKLWLVQNKLPKTLTRLRDTPPRHSVNQNPTFLYVEKTIQREISRDKKWDIFQGLYTLNKNWKKTMSKKWTTKKLKKTMSNKWVHILSYTFIYLHILPYTFIYFQIALYTFIYPHIHQSIEY